MSDGGRILVVDDQAEVQKLLTRVLTTAGYSVQAAGNGRAAMAAVAGQAPELILLDIQLGDQNGLEVCRRLAASAATRDIPVILFSGQADIAEWTAGLAAGAVDFLAKPVRNAELLARLRTHLLLSRTRREQAQQAARLAQANLDLQAELQERQRADHALRESEERLRSVFESAHDGMVVADLETRRFNYGNRRMAALLGRRPDELLRLRIDDIHPAADLPRVLAEFQLSSQKDGHFSPDLPVLRADGSVFFADVATSHVRNHGKTHVLSIFRDITNQKRATETLRDTERDLRLAIEGADLGTWMVEPATGQFRASARAKIIHGFDPDATLGAEEAMSVTHPEDRAKVAAAMEQVLTKGVPLAQETRIVTPDGEVRWIATHGRLARDGQHPRICGIVRDITAMKQAEEALRRESAERELLERAILEVSEREQQRLGQDLHDDLCQFLTGIQIQSHLLAEQLAAHTAPDAAQARQIANHLRDAVRHARDLAHGLLPDSLDAEGLPVALERLAYRTQTVFKTECHFRCLKSNRLAEAAQVVHLYRIAQEAVSNAIKHGKARQITITVSCTKTRLTLSVHDHGKGISGDLAKSKGMGLRIMRFRATLIGGTLTVKSRKSRGTTVTCVLPLPAAQGR